MPEPRWFTDTSAGHSAAYVTRIRAMAASGADLGGEARFMDALLPPASRILDAGCGPGRVGAEMHQRGHAVVGVDVDPVLIEAAIEDYPGPTWLVQDLSELALPGPSFDGAILAGNVIPYAAPGTEAEVLRRVAGHVDGPIVVGFHVARLPVEAFDEWVLESGLRVDLRLATWDLLPWHAAADFAVSVLRR